MAYRTTTVLIILATLLLGAISLVLFVNDSGEFGPKRNSQKIKIASSVPVDVSQEVTTLAETGELKNMGYNLLLSGGILLLFIGGSAYMRNKDKIDQ